MKFGKQLPVISKIMPLTNNLYRLKKVDVYKASLVLRDAFMDYPAFKYLFPEINERKKKLRFVMMFFIKCGLLQGEVIAPSKNLECISIWYHSGNLNMGFTGLLKAGLLSTIYNLNIKSFVQFKNLGDAKKDNRKALLENEYYLLDIIGVDPSFERQGYARHVIDTMIEKMEKENVSCFLETSNFTNIDYYKKFGFALINNYTYNGLESYCMIRKMNAENS